MKTIYVGYCYTDLCSGQVSPIAYSDSCENLFKFMTKNYGCARDNWYIGTLPPIESELVYEFDN